MWNFVVLLPGAGSHDEEGEREARYNQRAAESN